MPPAEELIKHGLGEATFVVQSDGVVECVDTIELRPAKSREWKNAVDFHPHLNLAPAALPTTTTSSTAGEEDVPSSSPSSPDSSSCLYLSFEAKVRECLEVALSPVPKITMAITTVVVRLGGDGNTATTVSLVGRGDYAKKNKQKTPRIYQRVTGRVCRYDSWVKYWFCYDQGRLSFGIGGGPDGEPRRTITSLQLPPSPPVVVRSNDIEIQDSESMKEEEEEAASVKEEVDTASAAAVEPAETIKQESNENPTEHHQQHQKQQEMEVDATKPPYVSYCAVGFRNVGVEDRQKPTPLYLRSIRLSSKIPSDVTDGFSLAAQQQQDVPPPPPSPDDMIILGHNELASMSVTDQQAVELLLAHQQACIKARARATKFGVPYVEPDLAASLNWSDARRLRANPTRQPRTFFATGIDLSAKEEVEKKNQRQERFGVETTFLSPNDKKYSSTWLPIEQAWDKLELSGTQRLDPPAELWPENPLENNPFALEPATLVKAKIHIFSMDWAAFKQIRTDDLLRHFAEFGPTYVEWLGDLSCNILFVDEFSAIRAMNRMAQELPLGKDPDLGRMGWRLGKTHLQKVADDKFGKKGTTARLLMRFATSKDVLQQRPSWTKPPAGFSTKKILGPESDPLPKTSDAVAATTATASKQHSQKRQAPSTEEMLNGALSAPRRGGFSLADLEAERAAKRTKPS
jgi:hypothetical protein